MTQTSGLSRAKDDASGDRGRPSPHGEDPPVSGTHHALHRKRPLRGVRLQRAGSGRANPMESARRSQS